MTTDWTRYDVPTIASFLNEDLATSWSQVLAWEQTFSLLNGHSSRLGLARDSLAESWPPDQSPASSAFMANVDQMVSSMSDTADAAIINRDALMGVLSALESARVSVDQLHDKWHFYTDQEAINSTPHMLYVSLPDNWRQKLNAEAQATMAATDQAIFESTQKMIVPSGGTPITDIIKPMSDPVSMPTQPHAVTSGEFAGHKYTTPTTRGIRNPSSHPIVGAGGSETIDGVNPNDPVDPPVGSSDPVTSPPPTLSPDGTDIREPSLSLIEGAATGFLSSTTATKARPRSTRAQVSNPSAARAGTQATPNEEEPGMMIPPSALRDRERSGDRRTARTTKWAVPTGVRGLIEPVDAPIDHDPGPGVIGIDHP